MNSYLNKVLAETYEKNTKEPEFLQAVNEVLTSVKPVLDNHPEYENLAILERMVEPERSVTFRVPWVNDNGKVIEFNPLKIKDFYPQGEGNTGQGAQLVMPNLFRHLAPVEFI